MTSSKTRHYSVSDLLKVFSEDNAGRSFANKEIVDFIVDKYAKVNNGKEVKRGSVIPPDYCYNLINDGVIKRGKLTHKAYFIYEWDSKTYLCVGENADITTEIRHRNRGVVGECVKGDGRIFQNKFK